MSEESRLITEVLEKAPEAQGAIMAMIIALLRIIYDRKETRPLRIGLEAILCGALSLTFSFGIMAFGMDVKWSVFVGGAIGYLGPVTVRALLIKFIGVRIK